MSAKAAGDAQLRECLPALVFVADEARLRGRDITAIASGAVAGGVEIVQLRAKEVPHDRVVALARDIRNTIAGGALFFVNGDVDAALEVGADGVHLPEDGSSIAAVRARVGEGMLLSRAVHSPAAATAAEGDGADLLQVGTVFATGSKPGAVVLGPAGLAEICRSVRVPRVGIGGITPANAADVIRSGASGVAVIGAIADAADPGAAARDLRKALASAHARA